VPEMPEVQAHAERLTDSFAGRCLKAFRPLTFTALKTATPLPDEAYGRPLQLVGRRGKFLLVTFEPVTFVIHLMQGGRLLVDEKHSVKPRGGQARFLFEHQPNDPPGADPPALLLTEQGTERRAGVWCVSTTVALKSRPLDSLGPEADSIEPDALARLFEARPNTRVHGFLRDQHAVAGIGRRLANEVCHRAKVSPFAMTRKLGIDGATAIVAAIRESVGEGLAEERQRADMSSSKDRSSRVHGRTGEACPVCGDTIHAVEYASYTVNYCPTCQTGGKLLADNTTSKFLK
jgi:formamidopyrimidine-DNA glycosylase